MHDTGLTCKENPGQKLGCNRSWNPNDEAMMVIVLDDDGESWLENKTSPFEWKTKIIRKSMIPYLYAYDYVSLMNVWWMWTQVH